MSLQTFWMNVMIILYDNLINTQKLLKSEPKSRWFVSKFEKVKKILKNFEKSLVFFENMLYNDKVTYNNMTKR